MISFNPHWGGLDYLQDSTPGDGCSIVFLPSLANDSIAAAPQIGSEESVHQFMQSGFKASTENLYNAGLILSTGV